MISAAPPTTTCDLEPVERVVPQTASTTLWALSGPQRVGLVCVLILLAAHGNLSIFGGTARFGATGFFSRRGIASIIWSIGAFTAYPYWKRILARAWHDKLISMFPVIAVCSVAWSVPRFPALNSIFLVATTLFAFFLDEVLTIEQQHWAFCRAAWIVCIGGFVVALLFPAYGLDQVADMGALQGIFVGKNVCALALVFFLIAAMTRRCRSWTEYFFKVTLCSAISLSLLLTRSRTAWAVVLLLFGANAVLRVLNQLSPGRRLTLLAFLLVPLGLFVALGVLNMTSILEGMGRDVTLSGRVPLWSAIIVSGMKRPFLGYGYQAFWASGMRNEASAIFLEVGWKPGYAHNGLLEVFLWLGLAGVTLIVLFLLRSLANGWRCMLYQERGRLNMYLLIVFVSLLYNLDEAFLGAVNQLAWVMLLLASIRLRRESRTYKLAASTTGSLLPHPEMLTLASRLPWQPLGVGQTVRSTAKLSGES